MTRIESPAGFVVHVNTNGSIRRIEHGAVTLNLFPGSGAVTGAWEQWRRQTNLWGAA